MLKIIRTPDVFFPPTTNLSQAVVSNGFIYLMGCGARAVDGKIVGRDIRTQAVQCISNAENILKAAGATLRDCVRITCLLVNVEDTDIWNEVYNGIFHTNPPARSLFFIKGFRDPTMLCEVEVTARDPNFAR